MTGAYTANNETNSQQVASDVMANALAITCLMQGIEVRVDKYVIMYDMYS